jgi:hypothetical protein
MDAIQVHDRVTLESVQQQFSDWRAQRRSKKEPIPDRLWKAAERLCDVYTVGRVSSALRLSFTDLKRRLSGSQFDKEKSVPFLELEVGSLCSGQWELECIRADGGRLRMSATGGLPPLGDLLRGFWS